MRNAVLNQRKQVLAENGTRLNANLQEQFFKTANSAYQSNLPQPFENYKREFAN